MNQQITVPVQNKNVAVDGTEHIRQVLANTVKNLDLEQFKAVVVVVQPGSEVTALNVGLFDNVDDAWKVYEQHEMGTMFGGFITNYYNKEDFKSLIGDK